MKLRSEIAELQSDPFGERPKAVARRRLHLLGARFLFESDSPKLLRLVDLAYADLPRHRLSARPLDLRVSLRVMPAGKSHPRSRTEPAPVRMLSGAGQLAAAAGSSSFVAVSAEARSALVAVSRSMLDFPYHTRYELIEFAVFTLAARAVGLVPLHAACVGRADRGVLLMGPTGSGKSTVTLQCMLHGLEVMSEDSVFVASGRMLATGVPNYLHVKSESLRWLDSAEAKAAILKSPVIRRRSGAVKFEVDLRRGGYRMAAQAMKVCAIVFLSPRSAGRAPLLKPLAGSALTARMTAHQAYAANQPGWNDFCKRAARLPVYELRRSGHPSDAVELLTALLAPRT